MRLRGRCQGCGSVGLTLSFRGHRCLSCIAMATDDRGDEHDIDWDEPEPGVKLEPVPRATGMRRGPRFTRVVSSPGLLRRIDELHATGISGRAISREMGIPHATIAKWLRRNAA